MRAIAERMSDIAGNVPGPMPDCPGTVAEAMANCLRRFPGPVTHGFGHLLGLRNRMHLAGTALAWLFGSRN